MIKSAFFYFAHIACEMFYLATLQSPPETKALFSWSRDGDFPFQCEDDVEDRYQRQDGGVDAASIEAVQGSSRTSSTARSSRGSCSSSSSSGPASEMMQGVEYFCKLCAGDGMEDPLFICPCGCADFVHRFCLEQRMNRSPDGAYCPSCGAAYPVRRDTKHFWEWFLEKRSRAAATLFTLNLAFSIGNIVVLAMAWLYVVCEIRSSPWLPALVAGLLVFTIFWVAIGCVCFQVLFKPFARWRSTNTRLVPLLDHEGME